MLALLSIRRREAAIMVGFAVAYAFLEGFGISMLLPVLQYMESAGESVPTGAVWDFMVSFTDAIGVPVTLGTLLVLAFIPILLRQVAYFFSTWYVAVVQNRGLERLTGRSFSAVANADLGYVESQDQGLLVSFLTGHVSRCGQALVTYLRLVSLSMVVAVYGLILAGLSWQLALIAVTALATVSLAMRRILVRSRGHGADVTEATNSLYQVVRERLGAMRLIKMRAQEDAETAQVISVAGRLRGANTRIAIEGASVEVTVDPLLMLAVFVIVFVGFQVFGLTLASLGLFLFILLRLNAKAKEFNVGRQALASLMSAFDYVEGVLEQTQAAGTILGGSKEYPGLQRSLALQRVDFRYPGTERLVLNDISLEIQKGSLVALVGRSGAGKSTLADLVPRLRVASGGSVLFDGVPAEEFTLKSLRTTMGFLGQEPILLNDTIRANLLYGLDTEPSEGDIRKALDDSHSSEFVDELPGGVDSQVGDRGVRFSGGQRQRLALARVLLQDPDILILDEPTSALDSESEAYIQAALRRLHGLKTIIVVAHRLSTVEQADQIVVLHEGRIVEKGTHQELLDLNEHYRRLFEQQIHA